MTNRLIYNTIEEPPTLFELEWQKLWQDMPEFVQMKQEPFAKITVRFADETALQEFAELIGQKLTPKTKSIWHPFRPHRQNERFVYVNERD